MKKFQKISALVMSACLMFGLAACKDVVDDRPTEKATEEVATSTDVPYDNVTVKPNTLPVELPELGGDPIYVYSYNDVFGDRLDSEFRSRYPEYSDLVHYVNTSIDGNDATYMDILMEAANSAEAPSIFVVDDADVQAFMEWDYAVPIEECGINPAVYTDNAYSYTVEYGTDADGNLKAVTWQATPGAMFYNMKIAEEVLETSDPEKIQAMVSDIDGFMEVAAKMKEAGYYMISSPEDLMTPWLDTKQTPWVTDGELTVDDSVVDYMECAKEIYKNNYSMNQPRGTSRWSNNMANGRVFCYFGSSVWLTKGSVFVPQEQKYKVCEGPFVFHLGGSYIFLGKNCPNKELVALLLYTMTCDEDAMYDLGATDNDLPNNQAAVQQLLADEVVLGEVLVCETPYETFDEVAKQLDRGNATKYDTLIDGYLDAVSLTYNTGNKATIEAALESLQKRVEDGIEELAGDEEE